ncbi:MAG: NAD-dependent epimerase/dehydratase family protein [Eubacteriales bacterium]
MILPESKIYVAGHRGLIGSALMERLYEKGYCNLVYKKHDELDLTRQDDVETFFADEKPEYVILNAAVPANSVNIRNNPVGLMLDNTAIISNIISSCVKNSVKKLVYVCSIAAYPSDAACISTPDGFALLEDEMQPGRIEKETERYYAMPKLLGEEICRAINKTGKMQCVSVVVPHAYGYAYHYEDPNRLSVFPALIKRFYNATQTGAQYVEIWGTGKLRRELTFVSDIAAAYELLLRSETATGVYNVGSGRYVSVREMAEVIKSVSGYQGDIIFDITKPDAIEFPLLCSDKLRALGWKPEMTFVDGVKRAYSFFTEHYANMRENE